MNRNSYTITMVLTPEAPISHGSGTAGNTQVLRTVRRNVLVGDEWHEVEAPSVSGSSIKAALREAAVTYYCQRLGLGDGALSRDSLRLLLKGGRVGSGGSSVRLDELRAWRRIMPPLAVFGFMEGNITSPGQVSVMDAQPWVSELVDGGMYGDVADSVGVPPMPLARVWDERTYYAHDLAGSPAARLLTGKDRVSIEDKREEVNGKKVKSKEERRDANESMPHSYQVIRPGTPLVCQIRVDGANDVDFACLTLAIAAWKRAGARIGGGRSKGHGVCSLRIAGVTRWSAGHGPAEVDGIDADLPAQTLDPESSMREFVDAYHAHLDAVRDEALAVIGVGS